MAPVAALMLPLGVSAVPVLGDRSPWTHGPAAVLRDARLLPPLTSIAGALAAHWWRLRGSGGGVCSDWRSCVLKPVSRLLCGDEQGLRGLYGPFLVAPAGVYVDASAALLRAVDRSGGTRCLERYLELARLLEDAAGRLMPGKRFEASREAARLLEEMTGEGCLVPAEKLVRTHTHVALDHASRTVGYGLLYSQAYADYWTLAAGAEAGRVYVAAVAECGNQPEPGPGGLMQLGPRGSPYSLTLQAVDGAAGAGDWPGRGAGCGWRWIATSPAPICRTGELDRLAPRHPLAPRLTLVARSYTATAGGRRYVKDAPWPSLAPGTLLRCPAPRLLAPLAAAPSLEELAAAARALLAATDKP